MAGQRARAGDFFKKIHILRIPRKLLYDFVEFIRRERGRCFPRDLLIILEKVRVLIDCGDCIAQGRGEGVDDE